MQPVLREMVIADITPQAEGICSYVLKSADGAPLHTAPAGAHIDIHLPDGLIRQYSLCHDPASRDAYVIAVKREPQSRGGSLWFHEHAVVGACLQIGVPRSLLSPSPSARSHIMLAGGIGVTPLYSMAQHFLRNKTPFELHYFARSQSHVAFARELASDIFENRVSLHLAVEPADIPARLARIFAERPEGSHLYLCGPGPFMDAVRDSATGFWPAEAIHEEHFSAAQVASAKDGSFQVVLAKSGRTFDIPPGRSILDVLMAGGHDIEHSCEQGFCGSCITAVLDGDVEHRDTFLTQEEIRSGEWIMPCVSRASDNRLILDL